MSDKAKKIIIINGTATSGKDTFCNICNEYINAFTLSTIDKVKEAYTLLGWDGDKTEIHRKALSDIKDIATANLDHPYQFISKQINNFKKNDYYDLMFIHSREPNEIARFVKSYNCTTLLIKNPKVKILESNHADAEIEKYDYDYIILNDGTIKDLEQKAENFLKEMFNE